MNQKERREYLIRELLKEFPQYRKLNMPEQEGEQKQLLRSLMNVRPPRPASREFLDIQEDAWALVNSSSSFLCNNNCTTT